MKKVKIYIFIIIFILLLSCKIDRVKDGLVYSDSRAKESIDKSVSDAKRSIYMKLASSVSEEIGRDDIEVIAGEIENRDIIDFSNTNIITMSTKKRNDKYITKIKLNYSPLYTNTINILSSIKQEGLIDKNTFRAKSSIVIEKGIQLSPFTTSAIERNALNRARENLYNIIVKNGIDSTKALEMTNNAYIVEENYNKDEYIVVIESNIE